MYKNLKLLMSRSIEKDVQLNKQDKQMNNLISLVERQDVEGQKVNIAIEKM